MLQVSNCHYENEKMTQLVISPLFQTCIDFKCVNASALLPNLDCHAETTCHGRGVRQHFL